MTVKLPIVRMTGGFLRYYGQLRDAYVSAANGESIELYGTDFQGNMTFGRNVSVALQGGYNADYTSVDGSTGIQGSMTISSGTVTVSNLVIK